MREDGQRTCFILGKMANHGSVLLYDDMEGLLKWGGIGSYTGGTPLRVSSAAYDGNYGLQVTGRGGLPATYQWFYASRTVGLRKCKVFEIEWCSKLFTDHESPAYSLVFDLQGPDDNPRAGIEWDKEAGKFYYFGPGGTFIEVPGVSEILADESWHRWRLRIDVERRLYLGVGVNDLDFGLSGVALPVFPVVADERMIIALGVASWKRMRLGVWFDDLLVREV